MYLTTCAMYTTTFSSRKHWSTHCCALIDSSGYCVVPGHGQWAASPHRADTRGEHLVSHWGSRLDSWSCSGQSSVSFFSSVRSSPACDLCRVPRFDWRETAVGSSGGTRDAATSLCIDVKRPAAVTRHAERKKKKGKERLFTCSAGAAVDCELCPVFYIQLASCSSRAVSAMEAHVRPGGLRLTRYLWSVLPMDATSAGPRTPLPAAWIVFRQRERLDGGTHTCSPLLRSA